MICNRNFSSLVAITAELGLMLAGLIILSLPGQAVAQRIIIRSGGQPEATVVPTVPDSEQLKKAGVKDDNDGYLAYLKSIIPTPETKKTVDELIVKLGDSEWKVREEATEKLASLGMVAQDALKKAAAEGETEVQTRAKAALERSESGKILSVVLTRIAANKTPGATKSLIAILPQCESSNLQLLVRQAIAAAATADDLPTLREMAKSGQKQDRLVAIDVIIKMPNVKPLDEMKPFLNDPDDHVALRGARLLAASAERDCLDILVRLMGS